ncbi:MAG: cytochrome c family protein [Oceanicaulis sp.]
MGDLFFNKVAGAVLAIFLLILGLSTLADGLFHTEEPERPAYPVDMAVLESAAGAEEEEEQGPPDFGVLLAGADVGAGERVARRCASCHTFEEGGADGTGPHLWDVMGRDVAEVSGFNYSQAMNEYAEGGTEWGFQNMYDYLENPRGYVPGTAMSFAGLRQQEDRVNLIAYMRTLSNDPIAIPEPRESEAPADAEGEVAAGESAEAAGDAAPEGEEAAFEDIEGEGGEGGDETGFDPIEGDGEPQDG